jgi:hypothetical protein
MGIFHAKLATGAQTNVVRIALEHLLTNEPLGAVVCARGDATARLEQAMRDLNIAAAFVKHGDDLVPFTGAFHSPETTLYCTVNPDIAGVPLFTGELELNKYSASTGIIVTPKWRVPLKRCLAVLLAQPALRGATVWFAQHHRKPMFSRGGADRNIMSLSVDWSLYTTTIAGGVKRRFERVTNRTNWASVVASLKAPTPLILVVDSTTLTAMPRVSFSQCAFLLHVHTSYDGIPREPAISAVFQATYDTPLLQLINLQKRLFQRIPRHEFRIVVRALGSHQKVLFHVQYHAGAVWDSFYL